jgi:putative PIN family toxin of toxin-antitoxin system
LIRVVVDTNVFVSGIFWKGPPYQVLEIWSQGKFKLVVSSAILNEYERVMNELNMKAKVKNYDRILELVQLNAEIVNPAAFPVPVCRDQDDDKFLEAAVGGAVQYIVTGDEDLLALHSYQGIQILKPKEFLGEF